MSEVDTKLVLNRLADAFRTGFEWVIEKARAGETTDLAETWVELLASGLEDVSLLAPPAVDHNEPLLPFINTHTLKTELFFVVAGGLTGGPTIDVLLQVWFDTEDRSGGFGVPLFFRSVSTAQPIPTAIWSELRDAAARLSAVTPAGRILLFADRDGFDLGANTFARNEPMLVMNANTFVSMREPPRPRSGRLSYHFADDLASGWIGDPRLSGRSSSAPLDDLLRDFHVHHILRIRVVGGD